MPLPTRLDALERLQSLSDSLANRHLQLADLEAQAHRIRVETWMASDSEYISARDRMADFNAVDTTCDVITLKGEIAADTVLISFYENLLAWGVD